MTRAPTEFDIQRAVCINLDRFGVPGLVYWHTPNGGSRRDAFEGKRLRQIGLKAGIPDLFLLHGGRLYALEMKAPGGRLSPAQKDAAVALTDAGLTAWAVADSLAAALDQLRAWRLIQC